MENNKDKETEVELKREETPVWFKRSKEEIEALVIKFEEQGLSAEKIGLILRDNYGVPSTRLVADKISRIISKKKTYQPADLINLEKKVAKLKKHIESNKQDKVAKRDLGITLAKINKLKKYYSRKKAVK